MLKHKNTIKIIKSKQQGLSIIGILIAITIIAISLTAGLKFMNNALKATSIARHRLIASFLAEEGLELVKNYVYANNITDSDNNFQQLTNGKIYTISKEALSNPKNDQNLFDYNEINSGLCHVDNPPIIYEFIRCDSTVQTNKEQFDFFIRKIEVKEDALSNITCPNGKLVTAYVYWKEPWEGIDKLNITALPATYSNAFEEKASTCMYNLIKP